MTPRLLDEESVLAKLRMMRRLLDELAALGPVDRDRLLSDFPAQLVAERIISHLVDLAVAINSHAAASEMSEAPHDMARSFALAARAGLIDEDLAGRLAPSTGLRNVLVHAYLDLDMDRFVTAIPMAIDEYGEYVRQVAAWLQSRED